MTLFWCYIAAALEPVDAQVTRIVGKKTNESLVLNENHMRFILKYQKFYAPLRKSQRFLTFALDTLTCRFHLFCLS